MGRHLSRLGATALALAVGLAATSAAAEKLVVQSWGGFFGDAMKKAWFDPFTAETGIEVELVPQGSMMDALAKLKAQKNRMPVDVWVTGITPTILADQEGLLETIPLDRVPNAKDLPEAMVSDKYVGVWNIFYGIIYNTETVPFEITNWNDMFDPRLAGRVEVPHATGYGGKFILLLGWLNGGDASNIDPAWESLEKLRPNIGIISRSDPESIKFLTSGEVDVATMMPVGNYLKIASEGGGEKFRFVSPEPFVPANFNNVVLMKNGPNTEAGIKFINFILGKQPQEDIAAAISVLPATRTAEVPAKLADFAPALDKLRYPDEEAVTEGLPQWAERWEKEMADR